MNNKELITRFINGAVKGNTPVRNIQNGYYTYKGQTLKIVDNNLYNYSTLMAVRKDNNIIVNKNKYSVTTSKIQGMIKYLSSQYNKNIIEMGEGEINAIL